MNAGCRYNRSECRCALSQRSIPSGFKSTAARQPVHRRHRFLAGCAGMCVVLAVCLLSSPEANAFRQARSAHGAALTWTKRSFTVAASGYLPGFKNSDLVDATHWALSMWNDPRCAPITAAPSDRADSDIADIADIAVIVVNASEWPFRSSVAAHTEVVADPDGGVIQRAIIRLNAGHVFGPGTSGKAGTLDLKSVLLHEMGHALGLLHSRHHDAVMRAGVKPGMLLRVLTEDDRRGLCAAFAGK
jgi:Matrixin